MRLVRAGVYSAVAVGAFSLSLAALPVPQDNVAESARVVNVVFKPAVGELDVPIYDWAEIEKPAPVVIPEPAPAPAPEPEPVVTPAQVVNVDPGSAQEIARNQVVARGWGEDQFSCLVNLWNRESGWNAAALNKSSGAYGIPQSLPGAKMASAGADWQTNPATQITWGLDYISGRYSNPCGAWAHSEANNWY